MTTWASVAPQTSAYSGISELVNGYVVVGYVVDDYIAATGMWTVVASVSTVWA
jgi:hypothetical protein